MALDFIAGDDVSISFPFDFNISEDVLSEPSDDGASIRLNLSYPIKFTFSSTEHNSIFQNTNGIVSLDEVYKKYSLQNAELPNLDMPPAVAVYWTDIDTRLGGNDTNKLYARTIEREEDLLTAREIIQDYEGDTDGFEPKWTAVATYYRVNPYELNETAENSFQMAFAYDEENTWVILAYEKLQFFDPSSNSNFALIGVNGGNVFGDKRGKTLFQINSTEKMTDLVTGTNCGRKGVYVYSVYKFNSIEPEEEEQPETVFEWIIFFANKFWEIFQQFIQDVQNMFEK